MLVLQSALERRGMSACFMAEYWLCDTEAIRPLDCGYELRLLTAEDFAPLYDVIFQNCTLEVNVKNDWGYTPIELARKLPYRADLLRRMTE